MTKQEAIQFLRDLFDKDDSVSQGIIDKALSEDIKPMKQHKNESEIVSVIIVFALLFLLLGITLMAIGGRI